MNYCRIYDSLISRACNRTIVGYVERHHIIPKCIGGTDDADNIVSLTPEEHYLAHLLLIKIYPNVKGLLYAVKLMSGQGSNKKYGWVKRKISATGFSDKHKENFSKAQKARYIDIETPEEVDTRWKKYWEEKKKAKETDILLALIYSTV